MCVAPGHAAWAVAETGTVLAARQAASDRTRLRSADWLGDAADALTRAVTWNTAHVADIDRVLAPTTVRNRPSVR